LTGCSQQPEYDSSLPKFPATSTPSDISADTSKVVFKDVANPSLTTTNQQPLPATSTTALNPKHGAPGHRCNIAAGAPLNSPAQPAQQNAPVIETSATQPEALTNSGRTVKLNPAHGQPGHDCAIPVSKPLKG
jgi:hypothetical protein